MLFIIFLMLSAPIMTIGWPKVCTTCEIEKVTTALNPLIEPLEKYLHEHQLQNEHQALNKVLLDMGVDVTVAQGLPLQAFILQHQKILIKNMEKYIVTIISNESKKTAEKLEDQRKALEKNLEVKFEDLKNWLRPPPSDCLDILHSGEKISGVYTIQTHGLEVEVFCDMETEGGGWTVFLHREEQTPQLNFRRPWEDYKNGFGSPSGEHWMGNEALHLMTSSKNYSIRIEAMNPEGSPKKIWSEYSTFQVESEEHKYRLTLTGRNKNSTMHDGSNFSVNNGYKFSTFDQDNDGKKDVNCAEDDRWGKGSGFWFEHCSWNFPTNPYGSMWVNKWSNRDWTHRSAFQMQMKIRTT